MAIKPTKPTVPPAPSRSSPGPVFSAVADAFVAFFATLATYMSDSNDFVDARADEALAAAIGGGLPALTGHAGAMTRVNAGGTALEFRTPAQVLSDIGGAPATASAVGDYVFTALSSAPPGTLKCNGAAVSRTTYAALFAVLGTSFGAGNGTTTFNLPDFRGEFFRGWDDGRGVDAGRALGSAQAAAMIDHTHSGTTSTDGAHVHNAVVASGAGGVTTLNTSPGSAVANGTTIQSAGAHSHTITTGSPSTGGGPETRPRNVAGLICIRY